MKQWLLILSTLFISVSSYAAERIVTLGGDVTEISVCTRSTRTARCP